MIIVWAHSAGRAVWELRCNSNNYHNNYNYDYDYVQQQCNCNKVRM